MSVTTASMRMNDSHFIQSGGARKTQKMTAVQYELRGAGKTQKMTAVQHDVKGLNFRMTLPPHLQPSPLKLEQKVVVHSMGTDKKVALLACFIGHARAISSAWSAMRGLKGFFGERIFTHLAGINLVVGIFSVRNGISEVKRAEEISDLKGKSIASLKTLQGGIIAAAGAAFLSATLLSVAAYATSAKIVTAMAKSFVTLGGNLFSMLPVSTTISSLLQIDDYRRCSSMNPTTITPEERVDLLRKLEADKTYLVLPLEDKSCKVSAQEELLLKRKNALIGRVFGAECAGQLHSGEKEKAAAGMAASRKGKLFSSLFVAGNSIAGIALKVYESFSTTAASGAARAFALAKAIAQMAFDLFGVIRQLQKPAVSS
jgi:hypothetical protein